MDAADGSKVLVVDDEPQITRVLRTVLVSQGYQVRTAAEGEGALASFQEWNPELVITDLYMPHMDGIELCRRIRAVSTVPIIVLSVKGEERTKVEALDSGADDYVTKPFGIDELLARVRAALRRGAGGGAEASSFELGDFRIDFDARRVHAHGNEVRLTPKEFDLFVYMARRPNRVLTHASLLEAVWGVASQEQPEYLRVFMGQLRKKLEPDPSAPRYLLTEPWVGYRFNPKGSQQRWFEPVMGSRNPRRRARREIGSCETSTGLQEETPPVRNGEVQPRALPSLAVPGLTSTPGHHMKTVRVAD